MFDWMQKRMRAYNTIKPGHSNHCGARKGKNEARNNPEKMEIKLEDKEIHYIHPRNLISPTMQNSSV